LIAGSILIFTSSNNLPVPRIWTSFSFSLPRLLRSGKQNVWRSELTFWLAQAYSFLSRMLMFLILITVRLLNTLRTFSILFFVQGDLGPRYPLPW
jgi:hypothetical protein